VTLRCDPNREASVIPVTQQGDVNCNTRRRFCKDYRRSADEQSITTISAGETVMVSQARMMMGGIAAVAMLGLAAWAISQQAWLPDHPGTVEVKQLDPASWSVQITELGATAENKSAAKAR
jgi:hypothetical protein